jgi:CHAT domain-containing protein/tetratricopeptide (TPR) repeat protein
MGTDAVPRGLRTFLFLIWAGCCASGVHGLQGPVRAQSAERDYSSEPVTLRAGIDYLIEAEQHDADIVLSVRDQTGQLLAQVDAPTQRLGTETLLFRAPRSGAYRVEWRPREQQGTWGRVTLLITEAPSASAALRMETEAGRLYAQGTTESRELAAKMLMQALDAWDARLQPLDRARVALRLGWLNYLWLEQWEEAFRLAREARPLLNGKNEVLAASALVLQALAQLELAQIAAEPQRSASLRSVITDLETASAKFLGLGLAYERAFTQNNVGLARHYLGASDEAVETFARAAADFASMNERSREAMASQNVGWVRLEQGEYGAARATFEQALQRMQGFDDPVQRLGILNNLAVTQSVLGDLDRAIGSYRDAQNVAHRLGESSEEGRALHGLGATYVRAGNPERALQYFEQALQLRKSGRGRISTLLALGNVRREAGDLKEAIRVHEEARKLASLPLDRARTLVAVGLDRAAAGESAAALTAFEQAARENVGRRHEVTAVARIERARLLLNLGRRAEAAAAIDEALAIHAESASTLQLANAYALRATLRRLDGKLDGAAQDIDLAISNSDRGRSRLSSPDLRATYLAARSHMLEEKLTQLDLSRRADTAVQSLLVTERWRAASLKDRLRANLALTANAVDAQRRSLQDALVAASFQLDELQDRRVVDQARLVALSARIASYETELDALDSRLPHGSLGTFDAGALRRLQSHLAHTTVILFMTGRDASWRWIVTERTIEMQRIAGRGTLIPLIENAQRCWRTAPLPTQTNDPCREAAERLSAELLRKVAVPSGHRIIVVPDGFLSSVPFAALADPQQGAASALVQRHDLMIAPALALLQPRSGLPRRETVPSLALVADPRYSANSTPAVDRSSSLQNLPWTAIEARQLQSLWPGKVRVLTGAQARRQTVLEEIVGHFDILHFATHVTLNERSPDLSRIELSRFDELGKPVLSAVGPRDFRSRALGSELVVLSGCESALGKNLDTEGILGFQQSLLGAGARSVVASLWRVSDRSSQRLMIEFYRRLAAGEPADAALRAAQLSLARTREYSAPFHWAAFQFYGTELQHQPESSR